MKKIVPFKKDLTLNNIAYEIDSISLEHEILTKEEDSISGNFYITGSYKVTSASLIKEDFNFTLPFDIALDCRYDTLNMAIDIEDFYYELIDHKILKVNIDLYLEGELHEERCIDYEEESVNMNNININNNDNINNDVIIEKEDIKEEILDNKDDILRDEDNDNIDLFDKMDKEDNFSTYHVYIVKEEDTIDSILLKYNINREELDSYNSNITDIQIGDKLIIPCHKDE